MAKTDIPARFADLMNVASVLGACGYRFSKNNTHAVEFNRDGECVYLKTTDKLCLVFDPRVISSGTMLGGKVGYETWNSNFSAFPKKTRSGKGPEKFGIGFDLSKPADAQVVLIDRGLL